MAFITKEKLTDYDFSVERHDLIAMIAYEYGTLCQATGHFNGSINVLHKISVAAQKYDFVINDPDSDDWYIDTNKARDFAAEKAKEIHNEIFGGVKDE